MTQNRTTTGEPRKPNPPAFVAYSVSDQGRGRKFWNRLGGAWPQKNGSGFTIFVNVLPVDFDGRIVLVPPKEQDETGQAEIESASADEIAGEDAPF